jgi:energy-coupling factor transporter ATP-binding protein EcfA2
LLLFSLLPVEFLLNSDKISEPLNYDQKKTLEILKSHSVLVHGPPGTGKSQLIANAIGFATSSNLSVIMSSEKKASLDAVYKRLQQAGLHPFCLINYSKNEIKKMIRDLKKTWDFLSKEYSYNHFDLEPKYPYFKMVNELISKPKKEDLNLKKLIANLQNLDNAIISNNLDFREFLHFEHFINSLDKDLFRLTRKINFNKEWDEKNLIKYISNLCFLIN